MFVMRILTRWIDPDRLIQAKSWWIIGALALLTGLLFAATILLMSYSERSVHLTIATRDHFTRADNLGKELGAIEKQLKQYEQNLRVFVSHGNAFDLEATRKNQAEVLASRSRLDQLIQPSNWADLTRMNILIDTVFATGMRAMVLSQLGRKDDAMTEIAGIKTKNIVNNILNRSNRLFRIQVDSLNQQIEADASNTTDSFKTILLLLAALAGVLFILLIYSMARTVRRVMNDRREYRQIFEDQRKAAAFTQNLINILPIGFHSVNAEAVIIDMNQTELDWLGYTREEIVGKKRIVDLCYDKSHRDGFKEDFESYKKIGVAKNMEINMASKDGRAIPVLFNSKAVYDDKGRFDHSISTIYNFTERKKLENELVLARSEADNARRLKQLFMTNMSHEIRTPLNAILGFANLLGNANVAPELKEYTEGIQVSGSNLLAIVNDILDFEKIQSGMLRIEQIEFDLPGLLHSVVTMMHPSADEKGLTLHLSGDSGLPVMVLGDPMRLTQILVNLLSNAIKFTEQGSVYLNVKVLPQVSEDTPVRIQFNVMDTGIGIPESEQTRIFERFTQARSDTMRIYGGTGLGLAIVKQIVELQNGAITLKSAEGQGSTFSFELPFQKAHSDGLQKFGHLIEENNYPDFSGFHIMLVEDNPMNRRIAEINLLKCGLKVTQAKEGQEAIELLRANPGLYDLVFMDIQMPVMDGYSTSKYIRTEMGLTDLPIIAVTAHVLSGEREKVLASGMNDYLTKPVRLNDIYIVLMRYLTGFWNSAAFYEFTHGKDDNLHEIVGLFTRQFPQELECLQKALHSSDFPAVGTVAHNMQSTVGYTGFKASLGELLLQIEVAARVEQPNTVLLNQLYAKLVNNGQLAIGILQREALKKIKRPELPVLKRQRTFTRI